MNNESMSNEGTIPLFIIHCPHCSLPLTIFFIKDSPKSKKPPIDYIGLWEKSCFVPYLPHDDSTKEKGVPFYDLKKDSDDPSDYVEQRIYSFEDILAVKTVMPRILDLKEKLRRLKHVTARNSMKISNFV